MSDLPELRERLIAGAVWSVSIADHHADVLTPRMIERLYDASNAMREADAALQKLAELEAENAWRPIEEDHPHNKSVILAWEDWRDGKWIMAIGPISTGKRYSNGYSTVSQHGSATHFRPLPSSPKGDVA